METQLLKELHEIKIILSKLIGTEKENIEYRFSEEALDKAQKLYLKMAIDRGDWVKDSEISRYIKSAPWNAGGFIRKEFEFKNWIKRGHEYLYLKKDLIALGEELAKRNIDCKRYWEFLLDKAAFDKKMTSLDQQKNHREKPFKLPKGIKNIVTSEIPKPNPDLVRQDLINLKREYRDNKFEFYVDIYKGTYAMLKGIYHYQKYLDPQLKRLCKKWCEDFNYANHALELITGKKEKFVVNDPELIQL